MKKIIGAALSLTIGMAMNVPVLAEDIVILFTNDIHCAIEEGMGFAGLSAYKEYMEEKTPYVTLVDCGDAIQGEFIGLTSDGSYIVDIMNEVGYDLAVLGNHEFDYGKDALKARISQANAEYLSCNIRYTGSGENILREVKPYELVEYGDTCVGFVGMTTPYCSVPVLFMEDGEYVYDFTADNNGQDFYDCVQGYVDECRQKGADYIIALSHVGDGEEFGAFSSEEIAQNTAGIDVFLDGHAHSKLPCMIELNKNGEEVLIASTGTKFANIGQLVITEDGIITTSLISNYPNKDTRIQEFIDGIQAVYEEDLQQVVGVAEVTLTGFDGEVRLVRNRETNIGNFCADAYRAVSGADVAMINGGGVRADISQGDITYEDLFAVHPYGNNLCVVEATGQEILDALEMCSRNIRDVYEEDGNSVGEDGAFQQVSGLKFTIDTTVESSVTVDENDVFVSVDGARRVKNVCVLNQNGEYEALDPERTYTMATHDYLIKEGGNGLTIFQDNVLVLDDFTLDYQALVDYLEQMGGVVDERYADVEGRIVVE